MKIGIVITSIFNSGWLERMVNKLSKTEHFANTKIYFIPDNKTPKEIYDLAENLKYSNKLNIWMPTISEQNKFLAGICNPNFILENSDHRRNIGYIKAYADGVDVVVSMDDDNFPINDNFLDLHLQSLSSTAGDVVESSNEFYNNCELLEKDTIFHPRGFPLRRKTNNKNTFQPASELKIGVNAGMWSLAPDVDAISWLIHEKTYSEINTVDDIVLSDNTYCPINSQNTALLGDLIPAYYFVRMGYDIGGGLKFDRLGDIYSGYFLQKVAKALGYNIKFGNPVVTHERNSHNYLNDANAEWGCLRTIDLFCDWLAKVTLTGTTATVCYLQLAEELDDFASNASFDYMPTATRGFYHQMAHDMRVWSNIMRTIDDARAA